MKFLYAFLVISTISMTVLTAPFDRRATLVGPDEPGTLIKGPSSKATVKGPSGPLIAAAGDTGSVSSGRKDGGVVSSSGETPGIIAQAGPAIPVFPAVPIVAESVVPLKLTPQEEVVYVEAYELPTQYNDPIPETFFSKALH